MTGVSLWGGGVAESTALICPAAGPLWDGEPDVLRVPIGAALATLALCGGKLVMANGVLVVVRC